MSERVVVRICPEAMRVVRRKAEEENVNLGEAADSIIMSCAGAISPGALMVETALRVSELGKREKLTFSETLERLVRAGLARHAALIKYSRARGGGPPKLKRKRMT